MVERTMRATGAMTQQQFLARQVPAYMSSDFATILAQRRYRVTPLQTWWNANVLLALMQARDAGMTMLRVWGGGFYESEEFYYLCDVMGLLVWQDFPYGCSYYPDTGEYAELARVEATINTRLDHLILGLKDGRFALQAFDLGPGPLASLVKSLHLGQ